MSRESEHPKPRWWWRRLRENWEAWRRWSLQILWPVVLLVVALGSHLYLANRAVLRWHQIQRLHQDNWLLWWDIQTLRVRLARRHRQALEAYMKTEDWLWPAPQDVVYVDYRPPAPATKWDTSGWVLPPAPDLAGRSAVPEAYTRSLLDVLAQWWKERGRAWWQEVRP